MAAGDKIPKEIRNDVTRIFKYVKSCLPNPPEKHLEWLFEVYNTYVEPFNCKKITCRTDQQTVINVISTYVRLWSN